MTSARLEAVEALICERYNVRAIDGPLKEAIDADDVATLRALLNERELYQWRSRIFDALPSDEPEPQATVDVEADGDKPLDAMTKAELLEVAAERGIEVAASATKADILEALTETE